MAFVDPLDPATPADTDLVSEGDDRIRELKRALSERLSQVIEGWPDTDPLKLKLAAMDVDLSNAATIKVGLIADRPNPPDTSYYWATDEAALYVAEPTDADPLIDEWVRVNVPADESANITFGQLRVRTLTLSEQLLGLGAGTSFRTVQLPLASGTIAEYVPIGAKIRCRLATDVAWNEDWSWRGGLWQDADELDGGDVYGATLAPGDPLVQVSMAGIRAENTTATEQFRVSYGIYNNSGGAADIEVEIYLYLMAIASDTPIA